MFPSLEEVTFYVDLTETPSKSSLLSRKQAVVKFYKMFIYTCFSICLHKTYQLPRAAVTNYHKLV